MHLHQQAAVAVQAILAVSQRTQADLVVVQEMAEHSVMVILLVSHLHREIMAALPFLVLLAGAVAHQR
jgi:hypothetical protein